MKVDWHMIDSVDSIDFLLFLFIDGFSKCFVLAKTPDISEDGQRLIIKAI